MSIERTNRLYLGFVLVICAICLPFQYVIASEKAETTERLNASSKHALALIAPAKRWVVQFEIRNISYNKRYNAAGQKEAAGQPFDQINLNSTIFPALALLAPTASLGTTAFHASVASQRAQLTLGYGITEDITIGLIADYFTTKTKVSFAINGGNVGFNPLFNPTQAIAATNFPFAPVGGAITPMGTAGVQQILTSPAFGFAYKPIQTTTVSGSGDPTFGGLWRIYNDETQNLVLGAAFRAGLAKNDDPDNLFDISPADSSNDIFMQLEYFRNLGIGFDFRAKAVRTWQFADHVNKRLPAPGQLLATLASKENVKRNLGDFWEYDLEVGKALGNWRLGATWHRYEKNNDVYVSAIGSNTSGIANQAAISADQWRTSISWSGIEAWQRKDIPLPIIAKLETQGTYRGKNIPNLFDVYLLLTTFF